MTKAATPALLDVLIVDDSAIDAELLPLLLHDRGVAARFRHAHDAVSMRTALQSASPHLILSDVNMPGFGGAQAFALRCELAPQARFCFVSDDTASAIGLPKADGLVRKDAIDHLVTRIADWFGPHDAEVDA